MTGAGGHHHGTHPDPGGSGAAGFAAAVLPALPLLFLAAGYLLLVHRCRRKDPGRPPHTARTVSFLAGCALAALALLPPLGPAAHGDFRAHMAQHMLIGMYAPLGLVLGAPVTLLLRAVPSHRARRLTRLLRSRPARLLAHPVTALALSTGTLALLYFTPLYGLLTAQPWGHPALHAHFLLAGWLFAWVVAGPDPAPSRPSVPARLVLLGVAVAVHATVSQMLYGGFLIGVHVPVDEVRDAAQLMYYGGDIAELLLAAALVATWRPVRKAPAGAVPARRAAPRERAAPAG